MLKFLFIAFLIMVLIGIIIGLSTASINKEGKKKSFRRGKFYGRSAKIDKDIAKGYDFLDEDSLYKDDDDLEQHANKKWK